MAPLHPNTNGYSMASETKKALATLIQSSGSQIPDEILQSLSTVSLTTTNTGAPYFPTPLKQTEAVSALKAVEAAAATSIADLIWGQRQRPALVDMERASCFLFSSYLATVDGRDKADPGVKKHLKDTDLRQAQSILYRRLSANLYETKNEGEYYHLHGSLEASKALNMIGLPALNPEMTGYRECIDLIESRMKQFTVDELESKNYLNQQAGVPCLKWDQFRKTAHGRAILSQSPWTVDTLETRSPPTPFPCTSIPSHSPRPQILSGIKVLELCRIIAGPSMGRGLAEYGADVLKITCSDTLPDVPFFQVDVNTGKHTTDLDLKDERDRVLFEKLLMEADVVLDGYRPGALAKLGYSPERIVELTRPRGYGIVYVSENCFGHVGEWASRPGWQQIADCVTGLAWMQGESMGLNEPVVPPFPMSDYGTGCMGTIAALTGLFKRAKYGGSYIGRTSLVQYDVFLISLGQYSASTMRRVWHAHDPSFLEVRHADSVDEIGRRALASMRKAHPRLLSRRHFHESDSEGFRGRVKFVKPVVEVEGTWNGFLRASRPNGFDRPTWRGWEVEPEMLN